MASLGSLGTDRPPADVTFDWFGTQVRCHPDLSDTALVDFMDEAADIDEESPEAMKFTRRYLATIIHPDDFEDYWRIGREHRQRISDHLEVSKAVIEAVGKDAGTSSNGSADSARADGSLAASLQQAFPGRPDLQAGIGQDLINRGLKAV